MSQLDSLLQLLKKFRDEGDWEQFHNPKCISSKQSVLFARESFQGLS